MLPNSCRTLCALLALTFGSPANAADWIVGWETAHSAPDWPLQVGGAFSRDSDSDGVRVAFGQGQNVVVMARDGASDWRFDALVQPREGGLPNESRTAFALDADRLAIAFETDAGGAQRNVVVRVYRRNAGCSECWGLEQSLPIAMVDSSGVSIDMQGTWLAIGRPLAFSSTAGTVELYERTGAGATPWQFRARLEDPDGVAGKLSFGRRVVLTANEVQVAAPFEAIGGIPPRTWRCVLTPQPACVQAVLPPSTDINFNVAMASDGEWLAAGSPARTGVGDAVVWLYRRGAGNAWVFHESVEPLPGDAPASWGSSVSVASGLLAIGDPNWSDAGSLPNPGRVLAYAIDALVPAQRIASLTRDEIVDSQARFGHQPRVVGDTVFVSDDGQVSHWRRQGGGLSFAAAAPADLLLSRGQTSFGTGVAASRTRIAIARPALDQAGRVEIRDAAPGNADVELQSIVDPWPAAVGFPRALVLEAATLVATRTGAVGSDHRVGVWRQATMNALFAFEAELVRTPSDTTTQQWGNLVAVHGDRIAIASRSCAPPTACNARLTVFERSAGGTWTPALDTALLTGVGAQVVPSVVAIRGDRVAVCGGDCVLYARDGVGAWSRETDFAADIRGDALVLGERFLAGLRRSGGATLRIFERDSNGSWTLAANTPNEFLWERLAGDDRHLLVSSPIGDGTPADASGVVDVLERGATSWIRAQRVRGTGFSPALPIGGALAVTADFAALGVPEKLAPRGAGVVQVGRASPTLFGDGFE